MGTTVPTESLTENMKIWLRELYLTAAAEARGAASNSHLFALGSDGEEAAMHEDASEENRLYAQILEDMAKALEHDVSLDNVLSDAKARSVQVSAESLDKCVVDILQVKSGEEAHYLRFASLDWLEGGANSVEHKNYNHVYRFVEAPGLELGQKDAVAAFLESVYTRFNVQPPEDFKGHSLSMSDVVVLSKGSEQKAFYCDSVGFVELPERFAKEFEASLEKDSREIEL